MGPRGSWRWVALAAVLWGCGAAGAGGEAVPGGDVPAAGDVETFDAAEAVEAIEVRAELPPFQEDPAHVLFDLFADPVESPFPYDYFLDPSDGGIRVAPAPYSSVMLPFLDTLDTWVQDLRASRGFATWAPLVFLASVPLDPASLPATEAATLDAASAMRLLELDAAGAAVRPIPLRVAYREMTGQDGPRYLVTAWPQEPLTDDTTYLLVVTRALKTADGAPLGRSRGFAEVLGEADPRPADAVRTGLLAREQARLAPKVKGLAEASRVVAAADFTTGHAEVETRELLARFNHGGAHGPVAWDLDGDDDGTDDVAWGDAYAECPMTTAELAYGVHGTFQDARFAGPDDTFVRENGQWKEFAPESVEFWLMVPQGTGPFPVAILMHGLGGDHGQLCDVSRTLVRGGLATVRFDLPRHGKRGSGKLDFMDVNRPARTRDNLRQGAVDIACAALLIEGLAGGLDLLPAGAPDHAGDLDAAHIGLVGHSLGAIISAAYLPLGDRVRAAVLNVGGVGLADVVEAFLQPATDGGMWEIMGMVHAVSHVYWTGDGASWARHLLADPLPGTTTGRHVLLHEHIGDPTVPNASTERLARFAGVPLIAPGIHAVAGVDTVAADGAASGLWQVDGESHGAFAKTDDAQIDLERRQAATFLKAYFDTGTPRIITQ